MAPRQLLRTQTNQYDNLIAGDQIKPISDGFILKLGEVAKRGDLLGQILYAAQDAVPGGSNSGDGTLQDQEILEDWKLGDYLIRMTSPTDFQVSDPDLNILGTGTVGTVFNTGNQIQFIIVAGGLAFVASDEFTVTVERIYDGRVLRSLDTAFDGSQDPSIIMSNLDEIDATTEEQEVEGYIAGIFDHNSMEFFGSHTFENTKQDLRKLSIFLVDGEITSVI